MENDVMYCTACQENFTQNFSFCPACGAQLQGTEKLQTPGESAGYHLTIVREKNVRQRNLLLLGAVVLLTTLFTAGVIYSIFNKPLDVAAIETDDLYGFVSDIDPVTMDPAEEIKRDNDAGGGGGGRRDKIPASKGREATQTDNPLFSPSKDYVQMTDPTLKIRAATLGTKQNPSTNEVYGLYRGGSIPSDGQGCCGGQGDGRGKGQGVGIGDGLRFGNDGGPGGDGKDPFGGTKPDDKDAPKVKTPTNGGGTVAVKIISKPRAAYTDLARTNLVQGKVVLKVTFLASGEIGSIVTVSGLPGGLTEQAIAAARAIKFEPARVNGVAVATTRTIEYTFSIF